MPARPPSTGGSGAGAAEEIVDVLRSRTETARPRRGPMRRRAASASTDSGVRRYVQYESTQALMASANGVRPFGSGGSTGEPRSSSSFTIAGWARQAAT